MTVRIDITSEGPKKRQIIESAFGRIGIAGYEFGLTPEDVGVALTLLNGLMTEWPFSTISTWEAPEYGNGSADESSGIPREDVPAIVARLAQLLAAEFGKELSTGAVAEMARQIARFTSRKATVPSMPRRGDPIGAGSTRPGLSPFTRDAEPIAPGYDPGDLAGLVKE